MQGKIDPDVTDTSYHNGLRYSVVVEPQGFVVVDKQNHNQRVYGPAKGIGKTRYICSCLNELEVESKR